MGLPKRPERKGSWSEAAIRVLEERYLAKDEEGRTVETPDDMCWRVAWEIANAERAWGKGDEEIRGIAEKFYDMMIDKLFMPNSPTLMNAGRGTGLQYSACFVLPVGDSMDEIFEAIKRAAIIHKSGGGTGFSFSRLRPKDSIVRTSGGRASGPVSFMKVFDAATDAVKQGGKRRGANMGILRVDHPDILEFIECKLTGGITNFNISVAATDAFMKAVMEGGEYDLIAQPGWPAKGGGRFKGGEVIGKLSARDVFNRIVRAAWATGDPGLIFIDRINRSPANPVPELWEVEATNPCIAGDALIPTEKGLMRMEELVRRFSLGDDLRILVDNRMAKGMEAQFGTTLLPISRAIRSGMRETVRIVTESGYELVLTPDHKVMTNRGWVQAGDLIPGQDRVLIQSGAGRFNEDKALPFRVRNLFLGANGRRYRFNFPSEWSYELGLVLGWLVGRGWLRSDNRNYRVGFAFGRDDRGIMARIHGILSSWYGREIKPILRQGGSYHLSYHSKFLVDFFQKLGVHPVKAAEKRVPESIFTAPREAVIGFLQGLFTANGTVNHQEDMSAYIRLRSKSRALLQDVQLLLLNLGIPSRIYDRSRAPRIPFELAGEKRRYIGDGMLYELDISKELVLTFLEQVGFLEDRHRAKIEHLTSKGHYVPCFQTQVVAIKPAGKREVYDLTEPVTHSFVANGIVVSNCGEQPLYPNEACNLGSINLSKFVLGSEEWPVRNPEEAIEWDRLEMVVRLAVRFLDDVIEVNPFPLPEIKEMVGLNRRIGLGVMGWADMLFMLGIPYDSEEAAKLGEKIMGFIEEVGKDESSKLALERGTFPTWEKSIYRGIMPMRNATVTTIAPTGSISIIADCSSGIEPLFALAYEHRVKQPDGEERRISFVNKIFRRKMEEIGLWNERIERKVLEVGRIGEIEEIPEDVRRVFVTAHEIAPEWHVRMQAAFQKHTDNAVSKTVNLPNSATVEDVARIYLMAYEEGCKGITVYRDRCREEQVLYAGTGVEKRTAVREVKEEMTGEEKVIPRPRTLRGITYRVETPLGTAFITVNNDEQGDPFEIFCNIGKAGSDTTAVAEAIGRLISLILRLPSSLPPKEKLQQVIDQLQGIGGGRHLGFGPRRVRSLPDAIAQVLSEHLGTAPSIPDEIPQLSLSFDTMEEGTRIGDICPKCGQATFVYEEGCTKCLSCGYSEC
jgi:ribonucleoside-diphosphate reductase alpha chain